MTEQEVEVKFYLSDLAVLEQKLKLASAELIQKRVHEINYRYDTPDGALTRAHRVLRLRQDQSAMLTYKGPAEPGQPVSVRREIEVEVSSFSGTQHILEALGYQISLIYEKQRTTYLLHNVRVTLDEMPYGNFCEIEGPDADSIQAVAIELGLDWAARSVESYMTLFNRVREIRHLSMHNLTFADFRGMEITPVDLGINAADGVRSNHSLA